MMDIPFMKRVGEIMNSINALCDISVKDFVSMSYRYSTKPVATERSRKTALGLMLVVEGQATLTFGTKAITLHAGDGVFVPLNMMYKYSRTKPGKVFILNFSVYDASLFTDFITFHISEANHIVPYLDSFKNLFFSNSKSKRPALLSIFYSILQSVLRSGEAAEHPALKKAIGYVKDNLGNPLLNATEIACAAGYSEGHLRRLFKEIYKVSPMQYLNELRIDTAKNLLLSTGLSVKEISEQCGFNSPFYFSTIFKAKLGRSPSRYRDENNIFI